MAPVPQPRVHVRLVLKPKFIKKRKGKAGKNTSASASQGPGYGRGDSMAEAVLKASALETAVATAASLQQPVTTPAPQQSPPPAKPAQQQSQPSAALQPAAQQQSQPCAKPAEALQRDCPPDPEPVTAEPEVSGKTKPRGAAHAHYMRFWRSMNGKRVPPAVTEAYSKLKGRRGGLTALFEDWIQCKGDWGRSTLVARMTRVHSDRARGRYKLFNRKELLVKYDQNVELVDSLIARKRAEKEVHKDKNFPERVDLECYRCWDADEWEKEDASLEETMTELQANVSVSQVQGLMKADVFTCADPVYHKPTKKPRTTNTTPTTPSPGTPASLPEAVKVMRVARQEAQKQLKELNNKSVDAGTWLSRLLEAHVPESMAKGFAAEADSWSTRFGALRARIENDTIAAVNASNAALLESAIEDSRAAIEKYNEQAATVKRLMQPVKPKAKGKAKASSSTSA